MSKLWDATFAHCSCGWHVAFSDMDDTEVGVYH